MPEQKDSANNSQFSDRQKEGVMYGPSFGRETVKLAKVGNVILRANTLPQVVRNMIQGHTQESLAFTALGVFTKSLDELIHEYDGACSKDDGNRDLEAPRFFPRRQDDPTHEKYSDADNICSAE